MNVHIVLVRARELLVAGWAEPLPRDTSGAFCDLDAENLKTVDVKSALFFYAIDGREYVEALQLLESIARPAAAAYARACDIARQTGAPEDLELTVIAARAAVKAGPLFLEEWLEQPGRQLAHVLRVFDLAILRTKAVAA